MPYAEKGDRKKGPFKTQGFLHLDVVKPITTTPPRLAAVTAKYIF
jgi:hypothetical protein